MFIQNISQKKSSAWFLVNDVPNATLTLMAVAFGFFGTAACAKLGALSSLPHASYFGGGSWVVSIIFAGVACWRARSRSSGTQLEQKNKNMRDRILNPKPYSGTKDHLAIMLTHAHLIIDGIVLGDYQAFLSINLANDLPEGDYTHCREKDFKLVITVRSEGDEPGAPNCEQYGILRERIVVGDERDAWSPMKEHFSKVFPLIDAARDRGEAILIHCSAGSSRSAAFLYAYLMYACGVTAKQAYQYVHSIRPQVQLDWFKDGLFEYQAELQIQ